MGIVGRNKTADLVDCSATPSQYNGRSIVQQDENGTISELRVGPAYAYLPEPEKPDKRKKKAAAEDDF